MPEINQEDLDELHHQILGYRQVVLSGLAVLKRTNAKLVAMEKRLRALRFHQNKKQEVSNG